MTWERPALLAMMGIVAILAAIAWAATRRHHVRLAQAFPHGFDQRILPRGVRLRRGLAIASTLGALACVVVALAEPVMGGQEIDLEAEGVDLVLAVDLSRSMDAQDVDPSRLERARREILDLTERLQGDRVGLVIYAGGAYPRMPLTLDYAALKLLVRELDTHVFQAQGSNLAEAIREGLGLLDVAEAPAGRAIVVLTDGEIHRPEAALEAADEAAAAGVTVYGWVIGTDPAPIPDDAGGFLVDPRTGERALSAPDATTLEQVAQRTGGAVVRSVAGTSDAEALYDREIRRKLRATVGRRGSRQAQESAVGLPLLLAVALGLLGAWLGDGRRAATALALLLCLLPAHARAADPDTLRAADQAYRAGRPEVAARLYEDLVATEPDDPTLLQRLGAARYRAGDVRGAAEAFDRASRSGDADAAFNAGNAWWRAGLLERARDRYREALSRDPEHLPAQQNLQAIEQAIAQRQAAPEPQPPPPGQGEQGDPQQGEDGGQSQPQPGGESQDGPPPESPEGSASASEDPGEASGEPEGGEPQDDPQSGAPEQGQPGSSEPQDGAQDASGQGQPGEAPPDDGTRKEDGRGGDVPELDELNSDSPPPGEEPGEGGGQGKPLEEGAPPGQTQGGQAPADGGAGEDASRQQAERILDGVEEGRPRVYVPGRGGELPW